MPHRRDMHTPKGKRQTKRRNTDVRAKSSRRERTVGRRGAVAQKNERLPFAPPENWHESQPTDRPFRVLKQQPGAGYEHILSEADVRDRLADLPGHFVEELEVVQFSRMTAKKQSFPCYGMQWGTTIYLYPIEESLTETFWTPPRPELYNEVKMFGGSWNEGDGFWELIWSRRAIRDFYLNNILIHELGHLLDERNTGYTDRERYAEWFAIEHGYRATGGGGSRRGAKKHRKRHHRC